MKDLYLYIMNHLSDIKEKLLHTKPHLVDKYHVSSIGLFGSVLRNDFSDKSDIDIIIDFSKPIGIEFIDLADELEIILSRKVDLVSKNGIKPGYFKEIQSNILYV
jgi:predicted nucleotidyltransferase